MGLYPGGLKPGGGLKSGILRYCVRKSKHRQLIHQKSANADTAFTVRGSDRLRSLSLIILLDICSLNIAFGLLPQIVRTDLKELNDMSLDGAPYAYTPFCDSRTEMDGFR